MISDEAAAWFLMTEGSLAVACRWRQKRQKLISEACAAIANTDREMIDTLRAWLDSKRLRYGVMERPVRNGIILCVRIRGRSLLGFLRAVRPHLVGVKAKVADQVLAYFAIPNRASTKLSERFDKWNRILDIVEATNRLNAKSVISREKHRLHIEEIRAFLDKKKATTWQVQGKVCIRCGRFFPLPPFRMPTAKYCSRSCKYADMTDSRHYSRMARLREERRLTPNPALYEDVAEILEAVKG